MHDVIGWLPKCDVTFLSIVPLDTFHEKKYWHASFPLSVNGSQSYHPMSIQDTDYEEHI